MKEKKKKKFRLLKYVGLAVLCLVLLLAAANILAHHELIKYISSFDPVNYTGTDRVLPVFDESTGHYSFTSDDDIKIVVLTDLHICGGYAAKTRDMKAIYEIITMLQKEKPDLVILDGDNCFAVPAPIYNGGNSLNNKMASDIVLNIFEHEGVYMTTVFGNHDTEVFDYTSRKNLAAYYEKDKFTYSIFRSEYSDVDAAIPSVTNQIISLKNKDGSTRKLLLLLDTNAYVDKSIKSVLDWNYDVIHDAQLDWAEKEIKRLSGNGELLKSLCFFHIPTGEYQQALNELEANSFKDTETVKYIKGEWNELVNETLGVRVCFGGSMSYGKDPLNADNFFERLGPEGLNAIEACFAGHDHINNAAVEYKGVVLSYLYSIDNSAYDDIAGYGLQRGCNVITVHRDGSWEEEHKNVYLDYGADTDLFIHVDLDRHYYEEVLPY